jgi:hypothetical protein
MSASAWARCPRCQSELDKKVTTEEARVAAAYGVVPPDEYERLRAELRRMPREVEPTFREDYEILGAETGVVTVSYGGGCEVCGLSLGFTHERRLWP